jgi:hypothetical protein
MATLCGNDYVGKTGGGLDRIFSQVPKAPKGRSEFKHLVFHCKKS